MLPFIKQRFIFFRTRSCAKRSESWISWYVWRL